MFLFQINAVSIQQSFYSAENIYQGFNKNIKQHTVFNIDNMFLLEGFLKDHVTLKTGCWKCNFGISEINYIWQYIQIENSYLKCPYYAIFQVANIVLWVT